MRGRGLGLSPGLLLPRQGLLWGVLVRNDGNSGDERVCIINNVVKIWVKLENKELREKIKESTKNK